MTNRICVKRLGFSVAARNFQLSLPSVLSLAKIDKRSNNGRKAHKAGRVHHGLCVSSFERYPDQHTDDRCLILQGKDSDASVGFLSVDVNVLDCLSLLLTSARFVMSE